jgi:hypothetical protein
MLIPIDRVKNPVFRQVSIKDSSETLKRIFSAFLSGNAGTEIPMDASKCNLENTYRFYFRDNLGSGRNAGKKRNEEG